MDHQSFRFYIPGIIFLLPIYLVACWITLQNYTSPDIKTFVLIGGITTFPAIALPIGWWIYNAYRVWWLKITRGGYQNKDFVKLICKDTKPFYYPALNSILINFSHIKDIGTWIKIDTELFRETFYPFTSSRAFNQEIKKIGIHPKFTEAISDFVLFRDQSYDYARSISSTRYGLESSVFALVLGFMYAIGLRIVWLYQLDQRSNFFVFLLGITLIISLTLILIITLFYRWKATDKEYDARLILTTLTSINTNHIDAIEFGKMISQEITEKIDLLPINITSYAAFDMDNTLIDGDIGEAVFASLVNKNLTKGFCWKDYLQMIEQDRENAYKKVVEVMNGLKVDLIKSITLDLIQSDSRYIEIEDHKVPIPKPNEALQTIITYLKLLGIDVIVVTASNNVSAEIVCWEWFGIPASNVIGVNVNEDRKGRINFHNSSEIPYGIGKVSALKKRNTVRPIITGGDGLWDRYLLDYTENDGLIFWLGKDEKEYGFCKSEFLPGRDILFIKDDYKSNQNSTN